MKAFMNDEFLLTNQVGSELYHKYAEHCPIIDYHNHLNVADILSDRKFENIT